MMVCSSLMFSSLLPILMCPRYVLGGNILVLIIIMFSIVISFASLWQMVYYYSGGLRLNPNLYDCGKVCLSLLNTWSGNKNEMWMPKTSTMLQVLVSIQALILNAKPFFNEPGYANMYGGLEGERRSKAYNEDVFILSLKTMMYTLRRPPKVRIFALLLSSSCCDHYVFSCLDA
ncbi:hypothetical protein CsSME_00019700 [Camellia sinensis var. sinensis]